MTIAGWVLFLVALLVIAFAVFFICIDSSPTCKKIAVVMGIVAVVLVLLGELFYFNRTASGKRAFIDQRSELSNGIERTINVYTANGDIIATYKGKIDIAQNDGGYVKFDFEGKRYIYYNCFVETIANIE